jgi:hypothetical protein
VRTKVTLVTDDSCALQVVDLSVDPVSPCIDLLLRRPFPAQTIAIETGIDLISHNCLIFYETGYSLHTLRQASRRSWRIGQRKPVRVLYFHYSDTTQATCLRLMGKKRLVCWRWKETLPEKDCNRSTTVPTVPCA